MGDANPEQDQRASSEQEEMPAPNSETGERGLEALKSYILQHKIDMALWATRALTLIFCFSYILPIFR